MSREDLERVMFFQSAKEDASKAVQRNPRDATAHTQLGGALLELSHFQQGSDSFAMIQEGIDHFNIALEVEPTRHDTLWCLGNGYTSQGFLTADHDSAKDLFQQAKGAFQKALDEDPGNDMYRKAVEMTDKAPDLHADLHRQILAQEAQYQESPLLGARESGTSNSGGGGFSDFWYDAAGWVILLGLGAAWMTLFRTEQTANVSSSK